MTISSNIERYEGLLKSNFNETEPAGFVNQRLMEKEADRL